MKFNFKNLKRSQAALRKVAEANLGLTEEAMDEVSQKILKDAKAKAPVDTGALRDSGRILKKPDKKGGDIGIRAIKFGSSKAPYALFVNYDTTAQHDNGEALFLDNAVNKHGSELPELIQKKMRKRNRKR